MTTQPEKLIEQSIINWLTIRGFYVWKQKTTGTYDPKIRRFRKNPHMRKGVSDIIGVIPVGRFLAIEVKQPRAYPTKDQKAFMSAINNAGGLAFIARSVEDVATRFKVEGLIK